jgi:mannose-6-phosphate isomerase-like protein (cupin superfamily)
LSEPVIASAGEGLTAVGVSFEVREWAHGLMDGPPLHVHHSDDEAWHVLEGTLRFRFADRTVDVDAGGTVFAPAGVAHTYGNPGPGPVRYLIVSTARVFALIEALHNDADPADVQAIYQRFDSEVLESG